VRENLPQLRDALRELPTILQKLGEQASAAGSNQRPAELSGIRKQLREQQTQRYWLTTAAVSVLAGTLVFTLAPAPVFGWPIMAIGAVAAVAARPRK